MEKKLYTIIIYTENIAGMLNQVTAEKYRNGRSFILLNVDLPHNHDIIS